MSVKDDGEDDYGIREHSSGFLDVDGLGVLSMGAFQLHSFASVNSVHAGTPGFVSDDYLNAISADTTIPAAELEAAGLWVRRDGGYFVKADSAVNIVVEFNEEMERNAAECLERGYHEPSPESGGWITCETCLAPLKRPDGKPVAGTNGEPPEYDQPPKEEFDLD